MFKNNFIRFCNEKGESPSAVCRKVGITPATFSCWTEESVPRRATLLRIADYFGVTPEDLLVEETRGETVTLDGKDIYLIPLFESVSAGFGILARGEVQDHVPLYIAHPAEAKETICLRVRGDSMYPKIEDGDIIQVHKGDCVENGAIAVVLLDGEEGLVKKIAYGDGWLELHSINPMYKTMRFEGKDVKRIRFLGTVRKIIKSV